MHAHRPGRDYMACISVIIYFSFGVRSGPITEFTPTGIRVKAVPNTTLTATLSGSPSRAGTESGLRKKWRNRSLGFLRVMEISQAVLFLASDESPFAHGTELAGDSGHVAN